MSSISNRFYVTALEDGTTLHGNLVSDKVLTQSWNGEAAVPNWALVNNIAPFDQPVISLTLLSGATYVQSSDIDNQRWFYNGQGVDNEIHFMSTPSTLTYYTDENESETAQITGYWSKATPEAQSPDYRFFKYVESNNGVQKPALRITSNVASSNNVDTDVITFKGNYVINSAGVDFSATIQVRIAKLEAGSNLGVINFVNGISDITVKGQTITMYGKSYKSDGSFDTDVTTKWYLNESPTPTSGGNITVDGVQYTNAFQVTEADIVDHATIRCEFYKNTNLIYTAYASIDDMQDPEFMYVQYNGNNGNAASLRKGETATFKIWVGTRTDSTPIGGKATPTYNSIKVKLLDGDGNVIMDSGLGTSIPNPDAEGWRSLNGTMSEGAATITPNYDTVNGVGKKNLTGIILAETANNSNT